MYRGTLDCRFAAWAIRRLLPEAKYEVATGATVRQVRDGRVIYIGVLPSRKQLRRVLAAAKSVLVIDHRPRTMDQILEFAAEPNFFSLFTRTLSCAQTAWRWVTKGKQPPILIDCIGEVALARDGTAPEIKQREFDAEAVNAVASVIMSGDFEELDLYASAIYDNGRERRFLGDGYGWEQSGQWLRAFQLSRAASEAANSCPGTVRVGRRVYRAVAVNIGAWPLSAEIADAVRVLYAKRDPAPELILLWKYSVPGDRTMIRVLKFDPASAVNADSVTGRLAWTKRHPDTSGLPQWNVAVAPGLGIVGVFARA